MIQHVWSVLCHNASIDAETGSVSLFNLLETVTVLDAPKEAVKLQLRHEIFSEWVRANETIPAEGKMRIFFCHPDGERRQQIEIALDLRESTFARTRVKSAGLTVEKPGRYQFVVEMQDGAEGNWKVVAALPLVVVFKGNKEPADQG